jgi:hypothetical protein
MRLDRPNAALIAAESDVKPSINDGYRAKAVGSSQSGIAMRHSDLTGVSVPKTARDNGEKGVEQRGKYKLFRRHCDQLRLEAEKIFDFISEGVVADEGLEVIVEIEHHLETLYDCPWSEGENLRRVVVLLQSQLLNAKWTEKHAKFFREAIQLLRLSYVINADLIEQIFNLVEEFELDQFRGAVTETDVRRRYRIEEIVE